jgi:Ca-activated chloride channel family protein
MDLAGFRFQEPAWLWAALLAPLALASLLLRERQGARALLFPSLSKLARGRVGWRARLRHAPAALFALGLVLLSLALARPQLGSLRENVTTRGVDIVVALDVSGSMAAEDFQPLNRLAVAKQVVADFVERRGHDRIGLVVFAGKSLTKAPPTTDQAVLLRQLEDVKLDMLPDGTAIGSGLATALTRLRRSQARSRIVVLVTDGSNNAGEIDPATATDLARAMQVRVYSILVGRGGLVPMPVQVVDPLTGRALRRTVQAEVQVDEGLMKTIAAATGGEFFRASDTESLRSIFERIDRLEKSEIKLTAYRRYSELFPPVLAAGAALFAAAGLLWAGGLRVAPA